MKDARKQNHQDSYYTLMHLNEVINQHVNDFLKGDTEEHRELYKYPDLFIEDLEKAVGYAQSAAKLAEITAIYSKQNAKKSDWWNKHLYAATQVVRTQSKLAEVRATYKVDQKAKEFAAQYGNNS